MKFGIESEKILYDTKQKSIAHTAYRILDALNDYKAVYDNGPIERVLGEFSLNMIELTSSPSSNLLNVARDYVYSYELIKDVASRAGVTPLPIASYPSKFQPIMASKWRYFVQNAILSNDLQVGWNLKPEHKMFDAANCAGVHIHIEITTPSEFVMMNDEFSNKHNIASLLTPLIAFSSSPYFSGIHSAKSMRAEKYYFGIYDDFPMFGGTPIVTRDSNEIIKFYYDAVQQWEKRGTALGINKEDIRRITNRGGAHWGLVRWNRTWNTIELRFLDTDFIDMNLGKLAVVAGFTRAASANWTIKLTPSPILKKQSESNTNSRLREQIEGAFDFKNKIIYVPNQDMLHHLIRLAVKEGLQNELVYSYLEGLMKIAISGLGHQEKWLVEPITSSLKAKQTTSDSILERTSGKANVEEASFAPILESLIQEENDRFKGVKARLPKELQPPNEHPFPHGSLDPDLKEPLIKAV